MNPEPNTIPKQSDHFAPDAVAVELAVRFLESYPSVPSAEETKEQLAVHLQSARLTGEQRNRLAAVLLRALRHGSESVFRSCARLAPAVASPLFEAAVTCYAASCEYPVTERAQHVLDVLGARGAAPGKDQGPSNRVVLASRWCLHAASPSSATTTP